MVSFVKPNLLGSVRTFKRDIQDRILAARELKASSSVKEAGDEALKRLQAKLGLIMLQRSQSEVLKALLPPKYVYALFCNMAPSQRAAYQTIVDQVMRSIFLFEIRFPVSVL